MMIPKIDIGSRRPVLSRGQRFRKMKIAPKKIQPI
jgi:hypothetical protein